jgi:hypothetical protein
MRTVLIAFVLFALVAAGLAGCSSSNAQQPSQETVVADASALQPINLISEPLSGSASKLTDISVECSLPDAGAVMVYRVRPPSIDEKWVRDMADKLGLGSGSLDITDDDFYFEGEDGYLSVDRASGCVEYDTQEMREGGVEPLKDVREDAYYQATAEEFLKEKGLWPEEAVFSKVMKATVTMTNTSGREVVYPVRVEARFLREDLDGIQWGGVTPKISVYFGEGGVLVGVSMLWREVEPYAPYPTIEGNSALKNIKAGKATLYATSSQSKGTVRQFELVYLSDPVGYPQEFVAPYYLAKGVTPDGGEFTAYTRALPDSLIQETEPPSYKAPASQGPKR